MSESEIEAPRKVTFTSKEMFEESNKLCQQIPHWKSERENPIHHFVPSNERPFPDPDSDEKIEADCRRTERNFRLSGMQSRDRTLQLAGTMALKTRAMSPLSKIRETRGFVTKKRVNDVPEQKAMHAGKEYKRTGYKFTQILPHVFRDTKAENVLAFNQKDFVISSKPDAIANPHGLSEFNKLPKFHGELAA